MPSWGLSASLAIALLFAAIASGWICLSLLKAQVQHLQDSLSHAAVAQSPGADQLREAQFDAGDKLMPIWSHHIETARVQTELAINGLAERFSHLADELKRSTEMSAEVAGSLEGGMDTSFGHATPWRTTCFNAR